MPNLSDLRRYAGVLPDGDTTMLSACMTAAEHWFTNAGVQPPEQGEDSSLYDLGIYMLATHWYDQRGAMDLTGADGATIPFGVMTIMNQLRF